MQLSKEPQKEVAVPMRGRTAGHNPCQEQAGPYKEVAWAEARIWLVYLSQSSWTSTKPLALITMQAGCDRASTPRALCHIPSCILAAPCLRHARHRTSNGERHLSLSLPAVSATTTTGALTNEIALSAAQAAEHLASLAGVQRFTVVDKTPLGRGLVLSNAVIKQCIVSAPIENCLVITDEPLDGISVFGDRLLDLWQEKHGALPPVLIELLQGTSRVP